MRIVKQDQSGGQYTGWERVSGFPHDQKYNRDGESTQGRRPGAESNVGNIVIDVRIPDVVKLELAIITNHPPGEGEQELGERGMEIKAIRAL